MKFLKRLPVYATGAGFAALLFAIAEAGEWSDLTLFLAGLGVALFYTVAILVPWLITDQMNRAVHEGHLRLLVSEKLLYGYTINALEAIVDAGESNGGNHEPEAPVTHGRGVATHAPTSVLTR